MWAGQTAGSEGATASRRTSRMESGRYNFGMGNFCEHRGLGKVDADVGGRLFQGCMDLWAPGVEGSIRYEHRSPFEHTETIPDT